MVDNESRYYLLIMKLTIIFYHSPSEAISGNLQKSQSVILKEDSF